MRNADKNRMPSLYHLSYIIIVSADFRFTLSSVAVQDQYINNNWINKSVQESWTKCFILYF